MQITLHMHSLVHSGPGFPDFIQRRTIGQHHCHAAFGTLRAGSINTHRSIAHSTPCLKHCINNKKGEKKILTRYNVVSFRWLLLKCIPYLSINSIIYRTMFFYITPISCNLKINWLQESYSMLLLQTPIYINLFANDE